MQSKLTRDEALTLLQKYNKEPLPPLSRVDGRGRDALVCQPT